MTSRLFIFGLGYSGLEIARTVQAAGWLSPARAGQRKKPPASAADGIETIFSTARRRLRPTPSPAFRISSAPSRPARPAIRRSGVRRRLRAAPLAGLSLDDRRLRRSRQASWVDETTPPRPDPPRSIAAARRRARLAVAWREIGAPVDVFRLPGIYGPGRSAIDQVKAGTARRIDKPGQLFSRIHVEDIAATVLAAIDRPPPGAIYNVADDLPASSGEVIAYRLRAARPARYRPPFPWEQIAPTLSDMARSFYAENRRVRNDRIKRELGVVLRYPTYREGLRAIAPRRPGVAEGPVQAPTPSPTPPAPRPSQSAARCRPAC